WGLPVGIATPDTEREWLDLARERTVRALAAMIRAAGRSDVHEEEDCDDEPRLRFHLRCPRRVARLWQETIELARRMAGAELTQGQAAEAIAAEGLSARPPSGEAWPEPPPRLDALPDPEETGAAFAPDLDWTAVREAIPAEVSGLAIGCEELDAFALDARMRAVVRGRAREATVRRLSDEVEWALCGRDGVSPVPPPPAGASLAEPAWQMCARPEWELADSEITFTAPASVVALFRTAILAFTDRPDWYWIGCERLLGHVQAEWTAQPRHRDPVFERDRWRCAVPACTSRRNLHDHHILFRSR